jgi:hypothetical protein
MCSGELVTAMPSSNTENPHLEATDDAVRSASLRAHQWRSTRTEDLVAHVVLPDEVAQELLVDTSLVDNLRRRSALIDTNEKMCGSSYSSIPERTAELDRLQKDWLGLLKGEIVAQAEAHAHGPEAWDWDLHVAEFLRVNHVCGGDKC